MITLTIERLKIQTPAGFTDEQLRRVALDAALGAATVVRKNFRRLKELTGSKYFWHGAASSTQVAEQTEGSTAYVVVRQKGVRLHWKGGTVRPTGKPSEVTGKPTKALLIPFDDSPLKKRRVSLHELHYAEENIHVFKSHSGCPILVAAEHMKRKTKLIWLGKLVKAAHFDARPDVMPTPEAMLAAAADAGRTAIKRTIRQNRK